MVGGDVRVVVLRAAEISAENKASDDLTAGYSAASDSPHRNIERPRYSSEIGEAGKKDLLVRFLGTGAADWNGMDERGEFEAAFQPRS